MWQSDVVARHHGEAATTKVGNKTAQRCWTFSKSILRGEYEMCSSLYIRFRYACVASIGRFATALSGKTFTAI
jgi:hypothetical protein